MGTLTLADALRHSIGFEPFSRFAETAAQRATNFPPYNIEQTGEESYRLTLAVAGFTRDEVSITVKNRVLSIDACKAQEDTGTKSDFLPSFLHRGIALRDFTREFHLGEHVEVTAATLENGLLVLDLERRVPESAKPRLIAIS